MTNKHDQVDEVALAKEVAEYKRYSTRTSWAFLWFAVAVLFLIVFHRPQNWPGPVEEGRVVAQLVLCISVIIAYASNASMAERRGFILGRFGRTLAEFLAKPPRESNTR